MKIIFKEPGKPAELKDIPNELEDLQELVDGWVEAHTITEDMVIICNEGGTHQTDAIQLSRIC